MTELCRTCATPLGGGDRSCPACGAPAGGRIAGGQGRRVLLDSPVGAVDPPPLRRPSQQPRRPASVAATTSRRAGGGPVATGTVTGPVEHTEVYAIGPVQRGCAAGAAAVAALALLALLVLGGSHRGSGLWLLLPTLVAAVVLSAVPFVLPSQRTVTEMHRFRLTAVSGTVTACELLGSATGEPLGSGDAVEIFGRAGTPVRAAEIVRGAERMHGRAPLAYHVARHAPATALALSVISALITGALVLTA